jgi:hypothetical protein
MRGYPVFRVPTEAPKPTSGEAVNPQVEAIFRRPLGYLELFTRQSTAGPREVPELEVWERPPSTLRNMLTADPREVLELEVQKLETWMAGPLGGASGRSDSGHHQS